MSKKNKSLRAVEFQGEKVLIPIVSPGVQLSDDDKCEVAAMVFRIYQDGRKSLNKACKMCGFHATALYRWSREIEQIQQMLNEARRIRVENTLIDVSDNLQSLTIRLSKGGYKQKLKTVERIYEKVGDERKLVAEKEVEREIFIKPTTAFLMRLLEQLHPDKFSKEVMLAKKLEGATTDDIEKLIQSLRVVDEPKREIQPPIVSEDDAREYGLKIDRVKNN